jgi:type 1 glutamine amidotransferase
MSSKFRIAQLTARAGALALMVSISGVMSAQQPPAAAPTAPAPAGGRAGQAPPTPDACGGRSNQPEVACPEDVTKMMAVLPAKAPATPAKPRKVLVLGYVQGWAHSSRPLAAKTLEEMGKKTGAWTADITYDPSKITAENLKQYDALVLNSTTGLFLDDPNDPAVTEARRKALLDFVRGGKGLVGIHAAMDAYHGGGGRGRGRAGAPGAPGAAGSAAVTGAGAAPAAGTAPAAGAPAAAPGAGAAAGGANAAGGPPRSNLPLWPEFNKMIGGYFKHHWNYPTPITVKIEDPKNPINAAFNGRSFNIIDEVYTFEQDSWSRDNVRVLTSVDYSLMSDADKKEEGPSARTDGDYGLSWIRREGQGRVFNFVLGHHETIFYDNPAMLEHLLAGIQYALGDLKADDTPSGKK